MPLQRIFLVALICIVTFVCFRYTLGNQFTNWDDDYYVSNNKYITAFTPENLKVIFTEDITRNNYHPLCILSLAVNYHFAGLEPWSYYFTNVLIHMANVVLVFLLFVALCRRLQLSEGAATFMASFGALWFGIHPMHVESVAWIAERKDVMYAFFYVAGVFTYLRYTDGAGKKWYWGTFALFVASCLSKPMAVVFPMSLLCMDVLLQRKDMKKLLVEKVVFFLFSLIIGGAAFYTQHRTGAVASFSTLSVGERIMYAGYGFIMYIAKLFYPAHLSTFYPYPYRYISGSLPFIYYAAPFVALGMALLPGWLLYRRKSPWFRIYVFGMGFFIANVIFVLQFISVGAAIMADRYSYVAYIGLLFLVAYALQKLIEYRPSLRGAVVGISLVASSALAYACAERTKVWHNSRTLLTDAIEKYPYRALLSYKWRGHYYLSIGELDSAMMDYELLRSINMADAKVLNNIERIKALKAIQGGVPMLPENVSDTAYRPYMDSVVMCMAAGDTLGALRKYVSALRMNPQMAEKTLAESSNELVQSQHYQQAIWQYNLLMKITNTNPFYYFLRGCALFGAGRIKAAVQDWEFAAKMNSKDVQRSASYNLSVAYDTLGEPEKAYYHMNRALELGYKPSPDYVEKLRKKSDGRTR
ncbi:tetratricopeptide repeat protein [Nemorincola caseinilytica]|uniref:Tetratricopeptide repeat protein n=1 Tax=Nemorincola caseinilytica TaxID=2054315 RepID=A0ABP8NK68_9BACT